MLKIVEYCRRIEIEYAIIQLKVQSKETHNMSITDIRKKAQDQKTFIKQGEENE